MERLRAPDGEFPPPYAIAWGDDPVGIWIEILDLNGEGTIRLRWIEPRINGTTIIRPGFWQLPDSIKPDLVAPLIANIKSYTEEVLKYEIRGYDEPSVQS